MLPDAFWPSSSEQILYSSRAPQLSAAGSLGCDGQNCGKSIETETKGSWNLPFSYIGEMLSVKIFQADSYISSLAKPGNTRWFSIALPAVSPSLSLPLWLFCPGSCIEFRSCFSGLAVHGTKETMPERALYLHMCSISWKFHMSVHV